MVGDDDDGHQVAAPEGAVASTQVTPAIAAVSRPRTLVRLTVRAMPKTTSQQTITIRGRTTRGATVTARGKRAIVRRGIYRVRLKLRVGTNRFTVVARHEGQRARRRSMRFERVVPPPAPPEVGCGGDPYAYRGANGVCIGPAHPPSSGPASPADCPAGQMPVGVTGACAPPDPSSAPVGPDTNGPVDPSPAGTNWVEPDGCVGGDY